MKTTCMAMAVGALALTGTANADFIGLDLLDTPDIVSGFISVSFDAATDALIASGTAFELDLDGGAPLPITGGTFDLNASINDAGEVGGGDLSIGGMVGGFSGPSLLTGSLLDFGFADGGGMILEFLFTVEGGDLATEYGGVGAQFGVIMDLGDNYSGDWTQDLDVIASAVADAAPIPAPAGLALLGVAGVLGRRRRRR